MAKTDSTVPTATAIDPPKPMDKDNAVLLFGVCSDKFGELCALFGAIQAGLDEHSALRKLATLGKDVAFDYENQADCWHEQLRDGGFE